MDDRGTSAVIAHETDREGPVCWCGERGLRPFSPAYALCTTCGTLVARHGLTPEAAAVADDDRAFYGKDYWLSHQTNDLGNPDITRRARTDLSDRCMHWLRTLMGYKAPPARVLEIGCAHGGFVALLRWAGYDATGLELSPWVVDYARETFGVPVLLGPVEAQPVAEGSLDAIVLNDVVEHLPDPRATLAACARLLKPDGVLVVQMPSYPEGASFEQLRAGNSPFLHLMDGKEHLNLFSPRAARLLFERLGFSAIEFVRAHFDVHDMYVIAGRLPLVRTDPEALARTMMTPEQRVKLAWLDLLGEVELLQADRAARLDVIQRLDAECAARLDVIQRLEGAARQARADAAAARSECERLVGELRTRAATGSLTRKLMGLPRRAARYLKRSMRPRSVG
ncbi:class I SAM-dependent methyltransferase [Frigoriglobus tundricola]|uniref:Methyltransferase type 11 domain-containing protein n=1 Tax=Frigoriglobus tundricola TaxID=2774151 RepID=A0A6M5Z0P8_9BACT|nr:class I SAM-dependent methyltransferase [Frigoriglobus tundricola]QJW99909.1 hypothetical protein FTUN_7532 [Frigoriglobus tundricola]